MAQWRQSEVYAARDDPEGTACCSSRRPVRAHDSHTVSKSRAGVEMSLDTARRSACATSATNLAPHGSCSFLIDSEKPGDIRRSESSLGFATTVSVVEREAALKGGCSQDWLPHPFIPRSALSHRHASVHRLVAYLAAAACVRAGTIQGVVLEQASGRPLARTVVRLDPVPQSSGITSHSLTTRAGRSGQF